MTPEQQKALDDTATERAATLGQPHVNDGPQPYHAGALPPNDHVPGSAAVAPDPMPDSSSEPLTGLTEIPTQSGSSEGEAANG
jgi:hypothetical protein